MDCGQELVGSLIYNLSELKSTSFSLIPDLSRDKVPMILIV